MIRHAYFLKNKGPSAVKEMQITILWPEKSIEGQNLFELIAQPQVRVTDITNRLTATCDPIFLEVDIPVRRFSFKFHFVACVVCMSIICAHSLCFHSDR